MRAVGAGVVVGILAWTAFAFGGAYPGTLVVPAVACAALGAARRPGILSRGPSPGFDRILLLVLGVAVLHAVPLPQALVWALAPAAREVSGTLQFAAPGGIVPLTINPPASIAAALLLASVLLFFFTARQIYEHGGVRLTVRSVAVIGLALSAVALAQDASGSGMMYGRWRPLQEGAPPFGPFVNRNHFATWAVMAVPLCLGYLTAHAAAHPGLGRHTSWRARLVTWMDARAALLLASATLLILGIAAALSRSGLLGLAAALACGGTLAHRHAGGITTRPTRTAVLIIVAAMLAAFAVLTQVGPGAITGRLATSDVAVADRVTIWRDTVPVLRDFWLTGTGVGTYGTAMAVYQRSSPGVLFNQAHNHYLQVAAEGGLVLALPVLLALVAFGRLAWDRLRADRSGMFWIRAGAASGLAGVAVQSVWETGLTLPANAALAAVLAALVVHVPMRVSPGETR